MPAKFILNAMLGKDKAIVTDIAGTTRDIIESKIKLSGIWTSDVVENMGIEREALKAD